MNQAKASKKRLSFIEKIAFTGNSCAALALVASYAATRISPSAFWPLAFFGLAYPVLVILNMFFLCYWIILGKWWFLISFVLLAAGYRFLSNTVSLNGLWVPAGSAHSHRLRLMTYNVHFFRRFNESLSGPVKHQILQLIKGEDPDVLFMQEYFSRKRGTFCIADSLARITQTHFAAYHACDSNTFESAGIAVFSRYPISHIVFVPLTKQRRSVNGLIECDIKLPGKTVRAISVQLQSISFQQQDYEFLDQLRDGNEPGAESYRHIGGKLKMAFIHRSVQAQILARVIRESPYPIILGGDFNDPPVSYAYTTISKGLKNCFTEKGLGFATTYHGSFPNFQIDYLLCDSAFKVQNYRVIKKDLSDHYAVRSDLAF